MDAESVLLLFLRLCHRIGSDPQALNPQKEGKKTLEVKIKQYEMIKHVLRNYSFLKYLTSFSKGLPGYITLALGKTRNP